LSSKYSYCFCPRRTGRNRALLFAGAHKMLASSFASKKTLGMFNGT